MSLFLWILLNTRSSNRCTVIPNGLSEEEIHLSESEDETDVVQHGSQDKSIIDKIVHLTKRMILKKLYQIQHPKEKNNYIEKRKILEFQQRILQERFPTTTNT